MTDDVFHARAPSHAQHTFNRSARLMGLATKMAAYVWRNLVAHSQHSPKERNRSYARGVRY